MTVETDILVSLRCAMNKDHGDRNAHLLWNFLRGTPYSQVESRVGEWNLAYKNRIVGEAWFKLKDTFPPADLNPVLDSLSVRVESWLLASPPVVVPCNRKFYRKSSCEVASCPETV